MLFCKHQKHKDFQALWIAVIINAEFSAVFYKYSIFLIVSLS